MTTFRALDDFSKTTLYELHLFQAGRWIVSGQYVDATDALADAHRLDRRGKLVRLRAETLNRSGRGLSTRTIFLSSAVKTIWRDERRKLALPSAGVSHKPATAIADHSRGLNPYALLAKFGVIAFAGLAMLVALQSLYHVH